jgi:predicted nucleotidyltransferase
MISTLKSGLTEADISDIISVIKRYPEIDEVILFGSRAKGNYRPGSDVDLALKLQGKDISNQLSGTLNDESLMPYHFDVLNVANITSPELLDHINRVGVTLFKKDL